MQPAPRKPSPELTPGSALTSLLFGERKSQQQRRRIMSDITMEAAVNKAFGFDEFSLVPIDEPIGKHFYLAPTIPFLNC